MTNLYLHYFKSSNIERRKELDYCVKKNISNPLIDKIYLLLENGKDVSMWMQSEKVVIVDNNKRMNFHDIFKYSNSVENDDINIVCNLDIFFDDSLSKLKEHSLDNTFLALSRWNIDVKTKQANLFNVNCSQDTWIWKGKIDLDKIIVDYFLGQVGCDNAICGEFHNNGYLVINPCLDIKTYHLHQDTSRAYTDNDVVRKKLYLLYPSKDWTKTTIQYWKDCTNFIEN
jgi:hypothetical protein